MKFEIVVHSVSTSIALSASTAAWVGGWMPTSPPGDDYRVIQFTPPGSGVRSSSQDVTCAAPGSAQGLYLIVSDIAAAATSCSATASRSARLSTAPPTSTSARTSPICLGGSGFAVQTRPPQLRSFASFKDPEATAGCCRRSPRDCRTRRRDTTFTSSTELAAALRRAATAHGEHEKRIGKHDEEWADWYADYIVREQAGEELPTERRLRRHRRRLAGHWHNASEEFQQ